MTEHLVQWIMHPHWSLVYTVMNCQRIVIGVQQELMLVAMGPKGFDVMFVIVVVAVHRVVWR